MGDQTLDRGSNPPVDPLTHKNAEGVVYQREAAVERQIRESLALGRDQLRDRAKHQQSADLREESLVYLIRHYHQTGDRGMVNDLSEALLRRCAGLIERYLSRLGTQAARDGYDDVIGGLFARILDLESDRGDFLQVRFWVVLKRLAIRAFKQQVTHRKRAQEEAPLTSLAGYDRDEDDPSGQSAQPLRDVETASTAATADIERYQLAQEALTRLEEPYRSAFLLRHYAGWPVEDEDPSVRTISRQFGKTPRTIRNWLNRAEDALQKWRGEE